MANRTGTNVAVELDKLNEADACFCSSGIFLQFFPHLRPHQETPDKRPAIVSLSSADDN